MFGSVAKRGVCGQLRSGPLSHRTATTPPLLVHCPLTLSRKAWPKIRYRKRVGITADQHKKILAVTKRKVDQLFFRAFIPFAMLWKNIRWLLDQLACLSVMPA